MQELVPPMGGRLPRMGLCQAPRVRAELGELGAVAGEPLERADAAWVRERTGFAIGGIPPLGHAEELRTVIDEDLLGYEEVWAAAGTPRTVFGVAPAELVRVTGGAVAAVRG